MSKSSAAKSFTLAGWVAGIALLAIAVVVSTGSAKPGWRRSSPAVATAASKPTLSHPTVTAATQGRIRASYAALPLAFEANQGQVDPSVKYVARGSGYRLFLTSKQAILTLPMHTGSKLDFIERAVLHHAIETSAGNKSAAARMVGVDRRALDRRMRRLADGTQPDDEPDDDSVDDV